MLIASLSAVVLVIVGIMQVNIMAKSQVLVPVVYAFTITLVLLLLYLILRRKPKMCHAQKPADGGA
jgi:hypothetical protein